MAVSEKVKRIIYRYYKAQELSANQFEAIEPISSSVQEYNQAGECVSGSYFQEDCGVTAQQYYENGLLVREESELHTTNYQYDDKGNLVSYVVNDDAGSHCFTISYDEQGNKVEQMVSDVEEQNYKCIYNPDGLLIEKFVGEYEEQHYVYEYNERGQVELEVFNDGFTSITTLNKYDDEGTLVEVKIVTSECEDEEQYSICSLQLFEYLYDDGSKTTGQIKCYNCKAEDANCFFDTGNFTRELFELRQIKRDEYCEGDNTITVITRTSNDAVTYKHIYVEDALGRLIKSVDAEYDDTEGLIVSEQIYEYWEC